MPNKASSLLFLASVDFIFKCTLYEGYECKEITLKRSEFHLAMVSFSATYKVIFGLIIVQCYIIAGQNNAK